jgi:hypothetical protein
VDLINVSDLGQGIAFWSAALGATEETLPVNSQPVYCQAAPARLRHPHIAPEDRRPEDLQRAHAPRPGD